MNRNSLSSGLIFCLLSALLLGACASSSKPASPERVPAQAMSPQEQYQMLYEILGTEAVPQTVNWEDYRSIESKRFLCFDSSNVGTIVTGKEIYSRRKRYFMLPTGSRCKIFPDKSVDDIIHEATEKR